MGVYEEERVPENTKVGIGKQAKTGRGQKLWMVFVLLATIILSLAFYLFSGNGFDLFSKSNKTVKFESAVSVKKIDKKPWWQKLFGQAKYEF
jgi:hypothetical protein